jgi:ABC-type sugar transport system substrate-binding protein
VAERYLATHFSFVYRQAVTVAAGEETLATGLETGTTAFTAEQLALIDQIIAARVAASTVTPPAASATDAPASTSSFSGKLASL